MGKVVTFVIRVFLMVIILAAAAPAKAQIKVEKELDAVPEHLQARLIERLNLYVEYESTKQYEKLYDLLLESAAPAKNPDPEAYAIASENALAKGYRSILLKFKPESTLAIALDDVDIIRYDIWGVAKVNDGEKIYEREASIEARWINGDWYFSGVADVIID